MTSRRLLFGAVADDDTGATDLAGMLAERGVPTVLVIDVPEEQEFAGYIPEAAAIVLAVNTRAQPPAIAYSRTRQAVELLAPHAPRHTFIKYCSTFDSTVAGNIGPSLDAAMDLLQESFTIAVPALPVNGRTTYRGYHFAGDQLLSDSSMRTHPLTPMTNPHLVSHLAAQTGRKVGLAPYESVEAGPEALAATLRQLRQQEVQIAIVDCLSDHHLETIGSVAADMRLLSGSSALGQVLPGHWDLPPTGAFVPRRVASAACLIVAGSCSAATQEQNRWLAAQGVASCTLDPAALAAGELVDVPQAEVALRADRPFLLRTASDPGEIARVQHWGHNQGWSINELGLRIARGLAGVAEQVTRRAPPAGLIVAGGETSGAVCRALGVQALRVGRNICPGVPVCETLSDQPRPVVLKSGNFGGADFYGRALQAIAQPPVNPL